MRADIQRVGRDVQQVVEDAGDLGEQHADLLAALRRGRCPAASRPPARRRAPGTSARRNRAGRNTAPPAGRSCTRSASRCRDAAGRYADRQRSTISPSISRTRRSTPCAAGCCGPKFIVSGLDLDVGHRVSCRLAHAAASVRPFCGLLVARQHVRRRLPRATGSRSCGNPASASPARRRRASAPRRSAPRHSRSAGNPCAADGPRSRSR